MKLQPGETTLVIAGAWNPAILTPEWVIRHGLGRPAGEPVRVQAQVPAGLGMALDFPRFTFEGVSFTARPDALILSPVKTDEASIARVETVARNTLQQLTHTPIGGIGHNFEFRDAEPAADLLNPFSAATLSLAQHIPEQWDAQGTSLITTYRAGDVIVNVNRQYREQQLVVKFNFHHTTSSAQHCVALLSGEHGANTMYQNYQLARQLVADSFGGVEDENEPEAEA